MVGPVGHVALVVAFVASLAALVSFALSSRERAGAAEWARVGRWSWAAMAAGAAVASAMLWTGLFGGHYDLAYVYQQTSEAMPFRYQFSAFWAGQEGSLLLWGLMTAAVGGVLIRWSTRDGGGPQTGGAAAVEARRLFAGPVLAVVALCQAFLLSMIVGLQLGPVTVGANLFEPLAAKFPDAPMLQVAGFVPADGQGLNDLLQNPWMTIHPPMVFVGFTLLMVPFAFAVAGLARRRYTQWVRPALPWALAGSGVLGVAIMMGGWWAYETLSFGGWWAWDPVENSSLVPWLFAVAGPPRDGRPEEDGRRAQGGPLADGPRVPALHLLHVPHAVRHPGRGLGPQLRRPRALQPAPRLDRDDRGAGLRDACRGAGATSPPRPPRPRRSAASRWSSWAPCCSRSRAG